MILGLFRVYKYQYINSLKISVPYKYKQSHSLELKCEVSENLPP